MRGDTERIQRLARHILAVFFVAAGINHFVRPAFYRTIMPPYMPLPELLVAVSGLLEIVGGLGALSDRSRRAAGWLLTLLLLGVFPANIHMALRPELFPGIPPWALYARLPGQALLIAWVLWTTMGRIDSDAEGA